MSGQTQINPLLKLVLTLTLGIFASSTLAAVARSQEKISAVSTSETQDRINYTREILPILKRNCFACHHASGADGGLNLETLSSMQTGGDSGPAIVAQNSENSLLLTRVLAENDEHMPPIDNAVGASSLTEVEIDLIRNWIQQGAKVAPMEPETSISWQPIPESLRSVYALDISADGRWLACSRANRVSIYDLASRIEVAQLSDPTLRESFRETFGPIADVDMVHALAFTPDGNTLVTTGYRAVRIWEKSFKDVGLPEPLVESFKNAEVIVASTTKTQFAMTNELGDIELRRSESGELLHRLSGHHDQVVEILWCESAERLISFDAVGTMIAWQSSTGKPLARHVVSGGIRHAAASEDGQHIAIVNGKNELLRFKLNNDDPEQIASTLSIHEVALPAPITSVRAVAFLGGEEQLLVATDSQLQLFKVDGGVLLSEWSHEVPVSTLVSVGDSNVLTGATDGSLRLWDSTTGQQLFSISLAPAIQWQVRESIATVKRQIVKIERLEQQAKQLAAARKSEEEALKKVQANRDNAASKLGEAKAKEVQSKQQLTSTDKELEDTKVQLDSVTNLLAEQHLAADAEQATLKEVTEKAALAKVARDRQAELLAKAEQELQELESARAAGEERVKQKKQLLENSSKQKQDLENKRNALAQRRENQAKALKNASVAKQSAASELAKRDQALVTAKSGLALAEAAIPAQQKELEIAHTRKGLHELERDSLRHRQNSERSITSISLSPNNKSAACLLADGTIHVVDMESMREIGTPSDGKRYDDCVFDSNSTVCCTSVRGTQKRIDIEATWDLKSKLELTGSASSQATSLAVRGDGSLVAVGTGVASRSGSVKIFAIESGKLLRSYDDIHSDLVLNLQFSPSGHLLASAAADKTVRVLDVQHQRVLRSLDGHAHHVQGVTWQDDEQTIASASADQTIKIWDPHSGSQKRTIGGFGKELTSIAFVPASNQVVTTSGDGQIRVHDTGSGGMIRALNSGEFTYAGSMSNDGKIFASGGEDGSIRLWNLTDGKLIGELK